MTKETSASTSASGDSSAAAAPGVASAACMRSGLKAGMLAESSEVDSARLLATRTNARTRTISRLPTRLVWVSRMTRRWALDSLGGGRRSDLRAVAARSLGAAQRELHALGHGGEIALAVERRKNGAAHESRAAQTGQDCPAEPLYRYATAIDEIAGFTVNGQRRLMAEVDMIGLATRPVCAAPFAVIQNRPLHSHQRVACHKPRLGVPETRPTTGLMPRTHGTMPRFERSVNGPGPVVLVMPGSTWQPLRMRPCRCRIPRTDTSRRRKVGSRNVAQVRHRCGCRCTGWPLTAGLLRAVVRGRRYPRRDRAIAAPAALRKCANLLGLGVDTPAPPRLYTGPYGAPSAFTVRLRAFEAPH